jgi:acyl-CoA thioester hydrolase
MGYVYHGRYLEYFEAARTEMVREMGITYREMEENGVMLPVIHATLRFFNPVFYDEVIFVDVILQEEPGVRLKTAYEVFTERQPDKPHVSGEVHLCFMDMEKRKPIRAPEHILEAFRSFIKF